MMREQIAQVIAAGGKVYFKPTNFGAFAGIAVETSKEVRNGRMCEQNGQAIEDAMQELFDWFAEQSVE